MGFVRVYTKLRKTDMASRSPIFGFRLTSRNFMQAHSGALFIDPRRGRVGPGVMNRHAVGVYPARQTEVAKPRRLPA